MRALSAIERLDEITASQHNAQVIIAEPARHDPFPHARAPGGWAKLCPRTIQSEPVTRSGRAGKSNPYLKGALSQAAAAAAKPTPSSASATAASSNAAQAQGPSCVARSILVIV